MSSSLGATHCRGLHATPAGGAGTTASSGVLATARRCASAIPPPSRSTRCHSTCYVACHTLRNAVACTPRTVALARESVAPMRRWAGTDATRWFYRAELKARGRSFARASGMVPCGATWWRSSIFGCSELHAAGSIPVMLQASVAEGVDESAVNSLDYRRGGTTGKGWTKGVSGNPSGRAKHLLPNGKTVPQMARELVPKALRLLMRVMEDEQQPMPLRVQCAHVLLRTGHADAARDQVGASNVSFVVQRIAIPVAPTPGVLTSPVEAHVAPAKPTLESKSDCDVD
jgi:hypothetical protein